MILITAITLKVSTGIYRILLSVVISTKILNYEGFGAIKEGKGKLLLDVDTIFRIFQVVDEVI